MRSAIFALILGAGTAAFCQTQAQAQFIFSHDRNPPAAQPALHLNEPFSADPMKPFTPPLTSLNIFAPPAKAISSWSADAKVDPKMIIHPPQASLGLQQGIPVEQSEYSNLRMLPIDAPGFVMQAIPAQWPNSKVQGIPIQWPRLELGSVKNGSSTIPPVPVR